MAKFSSFIQLNRASSPLIQLLLLLLLLTTNNINTLNKILQTRCEYRSLHIDYVDFHKFRFLFHW